MSFHIGIDIGGSTTTIAIGNANREILHVSQQFDTIVSRGPKYTIDSIVEAIKKCGSEIGARLEEIVTIGVASPGPATLDGVLRAPPNLSAESWNGFSLRKSIEQAICKFAPTAKAVYIGAGHAAALGEYSIRTGQVKCMPSTAIGDQYDELSSLFMVTVGTGLGGGQISNGQPVRGIAGRAGHSGHIYLPDYAFRYAHDRRLLIGNACGTLESAVSLNALVHQLAYRLELDVWQTHPLNCTEISISEKARKLRNLASEGDALALELFDDQSRALGMGLLSVNYLGDHDLLVIGGGVCDLSHDIRERYLDNVTKAYQQFALDGFKDAGRMEFSICGDNASVIGAISHTYTY